MLGVKDCFASRRTVNSLLNETREKMQKVRCFLHSALRHSELLPEGGEGLLISRANQPSALLPMLPMLPALQGPARFTI